MWRAAFSTHTHTLDQRTNMPTHLRAETHSNESRSSLCYSKQPLETADNLNSLAVFPISLVPLPLTCLSLSSISLCCPIQAKATHVIEWGHGECWESKQVETPRLLHPTVKLKCTEQRCLSNRNENKSPQLWWKGLSNLATFVRRPSLWSKRAAASLSKPYDVWRKPSGGWRLT